MSNEVSVSRRIKDRKKNFRNWGSLDQHQVVEIKKLGIWRIVWRAWGIRTWQPLLWNSSSLFLWEATSETSLFGTLLTCYIPPAFMLPFNQKLRVLPCIKHVQLSCQWIERIFFCLCNLDSQWKIMPSSLTANPMNDFSNKFVSS